MYDIYRCSYIYMPSMVCMREKDQCDKMLTICSDENTWEFFHYSFSFFADLSTKSMKTMKRKRRRRTTNEGSPKTVAVCLGRKVEVKRDTELLGICPNLEYVRGSTWAKLGRQPAPRFLVQTAANSHSNNDTELTAPGGRELRSQAHRLGIPGATTRHLQVMHLAL